MTEPSQMPDAPEPVGKSAKATKGDTWKWWYYVLAGVGALAFAVYKYVDLTAWEDEGGTRRMRSTWAFLYDLFGKWGIVGTLAAFGILAIIAGFWFRTDKEVTEDASD